MDFQEYIFYIFFVGLTKFFFFVWAVMFSLILLKRFIIGSTV